MTRADAWLLDVTEEPGSGSGHGPGPGDALDLTPLDAHERERAAAFLRPADRHLYAVAHLALRTILGGLLGERPAGLVFGRDTCPCCGGPHGRPVLAVPSPPLHFSLSHTPGRVLVATAPVPVGADVEGRPAPESVRDLATVLHPRERAEVEAEPDPERRAAVFGRIWARKEAYLKGLGTGLGRDPGLDDLGGDLDGDPVREPGRHPAGWSVYDLPCGPRHHGALALRAAPRPAAGPRLRHFGSLAALRSELPTPAGE
ncbi:4'-phosphopantetheinyl transferase family protein [Streptomyces laurentii]|uniref:4'-phosphopantetheinyl transferase family protein n=1 Tax=Streptomyces laurentii TaxID=39478 RepID=UPI0036C13795